VGFELDTEEEGRMNEERKEKREEQSISRVQPILSNCFSHQVFD
jgi:hypothetical protein